MNAAMVHAVRLQLQVVLLVLRSDSRALVARLLPTTLVVHKDTIDASFATALVLREAAHLVGDSSLAVDSIGRLQCEWVGIEGRFA